jgi:cation diffusion facilitator family transporter
MEGAEGVDTPGGRAERASRRSLERTRQAGASRRTVRIALAANATIAVAKAIGGFISGSAGMLAEAGHSIADTTNQAFLLVSIGLSEREPTPERPFGHGQERFLWTFMAAIGMFLAGAAFAIGFGAYELSAGLGETGQYGVSYAVLALSALAEGTSWARAYRQTRREAHEAERPMLQHVRTSRDPNVKMVLFEDTAALVGVAIAAIGVALNQLTGSVYFDPAASVLIGLLLVSVAFWMGRDTKHLLLGRAARPEERDAIERAIEDHQDVEEVEQLLTLVLGPNSLLVAARIDFRGDVDAGRVEEAASEIDRALRDAVPDVTEVFLDPTPADEGG